MKRSALRPSPKPIQRRKPLRAKGGHLFPHRRNEEYMAWALERAKESECGVTLRDCCAPIETDCWGAMECDHVIPRSQGGPDIANIWFTCQVHHAEKTRIGPEAFAEKYDVNPWREAMSLYLKYLDARVDFVA